MSSRVNKAKKNEWKQRGWKAEAAFFKMLRAFDLDPIHRETLRDLRDLTSAPMGAGMVQWIHE